jgi:hypothetical protein
MRGADQGVQVNVGGDVYRVTPPLANVGTMVYKSLQAPGHELRLARILLSITHVGNGRM